MNRITRKQLEARVTRLNELTGNPTEPYTRNGDKLTANVGNYHISGAYGGFCVHQMCNESGGVTTPISYGHIPARELWDQLGAFLNGIELGLKMAAK